MGGGSTTLLAKGDYLKSVICNYPASNKLTEIGSRKGGSYNYTILYIS